MIPANELRIGNWFSNGYDNYRLDTSSFMDMLNEAQVNGGKIPNAFPIQLTPDIIGKIGIQFDFPNFIKANKITQFIGLFKSTILIGEGNVTTFEFKGKLSPILPEISFKHLHQLQNLYVTLTGEELEIKL